MPAPAALRALPHVSHLSRARAHTAALFDYALPPSRIASHPLPTRTSSKLLVATSPPLHHHFRDLPSLLPATSLLVLNHSRVIPARLPMLKPSGARAELMLLTPCDLPDPSLALSLPARGQVWRAYIRARRLSPSALLTTPPAPGPSLSARLLSRDAQATRVLLDASPPTLPLAALLAARAVTPLPPYLNRPARPDDRANYQTTFAAVDGSVAAPTAGLHVTPDLLHRLRQAGVRTETLALHVGAGTFAPVQTDTVADHRMHEERVAVSPAALRAFADQSRRAKPIVALGTTSVRTLESLYWFGVRLLTDGALPPRGAFHVHQWEPYERMDTLGEDSLPDPHEAIDAILRWNANRDDPIYGTTELLIVPGYPFQLVDALITNFHQPRSTLLMLVSAFYGGDPEDLFELYNEALENDYRFLSYGDSSIFARPSFFDR